MSKAILQSEIEIIVSKCVEATVLAIHFREDDEDILPKLEAELRDVVRDELTKAGVPVQRKRRAIVTSPSAGQLNTVRSYLPSNFTACESSGTILGDVILIEGYDRAGWTLDRYVIPRLASGLIVVREVEEDSSQATD
tara:strand:- start:1017 stop:1430 length:414 start_codon:yes stop_codon:yes gene_type:complete